MKCPCCTIEPPYAGTPCSSPWATSHKAYYEGQADYKRRGCIKLNASADADSPSSGVTNE
jgi:hypothetical protein